MANLRKRVAACDLEPKKRTPDDTRPNDTKPNDTKPNDTRSNDSQAEDTDDRPLLSKVDKYFFFIFVTH